MFVRAVWRIKRLVDIKQTLKEWTLLRRVTPIFWGFPALTSPR